MRHNLKRMLKRRRRFEYNNLTTLPDGIFEGFTSIVFL